MGPDAMILVFWMLSFKPTFSLSSFTFIKRLFSSSSLSAINVVSSAHLKLLIFLLAIFIPACASSSPAYLISDIGLYCVCMCVCVCVWVWYLCLILVSLFGLGICLAKKCLWFLSKNKRHIFHFHQEHYWTTRSPFVPLLLSFSRQLHNSIFPKLFFFFWAKSCSRCLLNSTRELKIVH